MSRRVVLWAPFLAPSPTPPPAPLLNRLAGRSEPCSLVGGADDALVRAFAALGLTCPVAADCPAAAISAWADGLAPQTGQFWLRMDPVHLLPSRAQLLLMDLGHYPLDAGQAQRLIDDLNRHFAPLGWRCFAPHPERWYVLLPAAPALRTTPLAAAVGRSVDAVLPRGEDARDWHGLLNEVQMLLHGHPVNEAREEAGLPAVNSVWFWGGGSLPAAPAPLWRSVWTADPLLQALGRFSGAGARDCPADLAAWVSELADGAHLLVCAETLADGGLLRFETDYLTPLVGALKQGTIEQLSIVGGTALDDDPAPAMTVGRRDLGRWWRRARPFLATPRLGVSTTWPALARGG